ncbi:MAG: folate-binding protein [Solirubrobacterales bacterium]
MDVVTGGDQISQYEALSRRAAYHHAEAPGVLALTGPGAAQFLQGQVTNDVEKLETGDGTYAMLLSPKGKVRADMRILRSSDERLLVITAASSLPTVAQMINTFKIGFDFEVADNAGLVALVSIVGPRADAVLSDLIDQGVPPRNVENTSAMVSRSGASVRAIRSLLGIDLLGETAAIEAFVERLEASGVPSAPAEAVEIVRVEHGIPVFGLDFDEQTIPQEAGLNERAVSFTKGCYVGQETVARMHYKGKPNRYLRALGSDAQLQTGATIVSVDGKQLGVVGSSVISPSRGPLALAVLRREAAVDDVVDAGGTVARVLEPGM